MKSRPRSICSLCRPSAPKTIRATSASSLKSEPSRRLHTSLSSIASDLTGKQSTAFNYLVSLVLSMPNGSFNVFLDLLQETPKTQKEKTASMLHTSQKLDAHARASLKTSILPKHSPRHAKRLASAFIARSTYRHSLGCSASTENRLDLLPSWKWLCHPRAIRVRPSSVTRARAFFGRWIVSLLIRAAYERVGRPKPPPHAPPH